MPIYEYACGACGHQFEEWQKMSDKPIRTCPKCKAKKVEKLISHTSFTLKGGGWYSDLYAGPKPGAKSGDKSGDKSGETSGDKPSGDAGSDAAASAAPAKDSSAKDSKPADKKPAAKKAKAGAS
jgi:putative FmdB family regulatory protein